MVDEKESNPLANQHTLRWMWIAHFDDNTSLPQFDPNTYKENKFSEVLDNEDKLIKFGLYPFPPTLAKKLRENGHKVISIPYLSKFEINLDDHKRLINHRECYISDEQYHRCDSCGREFHLDPDTKKVDTKFDIPICPHCGEHDKFICKNCGKIYIRFEDASETDNMCECGGHLRHKKITSQQYSREKRWIIYHLGYQETIQGVNIKIILRINEEGNVEVVYE